MFFVKIFCTTVLSRSILRKFIKEGTTLVEHMEYAELLKRAKENMPEVVYEKERFEIPKVVGHIERNKTIISNFTQIAQYLHRQIGRAHV